MKPEKELQLVCFPYAGAGPSFFHDWNEKSEKLDILPVSMAGREKRFADPARTSVKDAIDDAYPEVMERVDLARGVVVFGHSMGAILAYELVRKLIETPEVFVVGLVVSGSPDPWSPRRERATGCDDDEFLRRVAQFAGYSHDALADPAMREILLPTLRADLEMHENYIALPESDLGIPIVVVRGSDDTLVPEEALPGWQRATSAGIHLGNIPGGHMYLTDSPDSLLRIIEDAFF